MRKKICVILSFKTFKCYKNFNILKYLKNFNVICILKII